MTFLPINERICEITTKIHNEQVVHLVSAYAPTLNKSEKNPQVRENFYSELESVIKKHKSRHITIIGGDFNGKIGKKQPDAYKNICGKYSKGHSNSNGEFLLEFAKTNSLVLTNTFFKHKLSHRTTWESPNTKQKNQIDFILVRRSKGIKIRNSRSYGGTLRWV